MAHKKKNDFLIRYTEVEETGALSEPTKLGKNFDFADKSEQDKLKKEFTPHTPPRLPI